MKRISAPLTISLTALFVLGMTTSYFLPTLSFWSAFGQTETLVQDGNNRNGNTLGNNNTVSYSYNIYNNSNNPASSVRLHNNSVHYYENNNSTGYLVYPELANNTQQRLPAVIMIHEWWGLNEDIKSQANILAREGYVVLAVDLYGGEVATTSDRSRELSSSVRNNPSSAIDNLQSAVNYVKSLEIVDGSKVASLGWCFGGDWSLQLALNSSSSEDPLAATIIYYGRPVTDTDSLSGISWPILGIFGDQDQAIPVESVKQFASALNASGITNEIYLYEGVGHAFANPSGDNYAPKETDDAWQKTIGFLKRYL
jgi:carboxymethylenebutenolidase